MNRQTIRRQSFERLLVEAIATTVRSEMNFKQMKGLFLAELSVELRRQTQAVEDLASQQDVLVEERKHLTTELENLANEVANHGGSKTLRSLIWQKEARMTAVVDLISQGQNPAKRVSEEEVDAFLKKAFDELADILLCEPTRSKQEIQKRISSLILTPSVHDGRPAYILSGDLSLFSGSELVLPTRTVHSTSQQHNYSIRLDQCLKLDARGAVVAVLDVGPNATVDESLLPLAA